MPPRTIPINLADRTYKAHIGASLIAELPSIVSRAAPSARRAFLVVDTGVPSPLAGRVQEALSANAMATPSAGMPYLTRFDITPTEPGKSLATLTDLLTALARSRHERFDPIIALGGGIVGDIAGFAAAVYRRGVPIIQCPTTLLAMVDASIGGKTAINLDIGGGLGDADLKKNLIGAFHQPNAVIADIECLPSLPARVLRCGLAECIKHGLIAGHAGDPGLFDWTIRNLPAILGHAPGPTLELIARNVAVKARFVETDEHEQASDADGGRALLNLGHTFGHVLETLPHLSPDLDPSNAPLQHGEAVALGLVAATACAAYLKICQPDLPDLVRSTLAAAGLPTRIAGLPADDRVLGLMGHDKKVLGGVLRLVLPTALGTARIVKDPPREAVVAGLAAIRLG